MLHMVYFLYMSIEKVVQKKKLGDLDNSHQKWWASQTAVDRLAHVEELRSYLRDEPDETGSRLQRVYTILPRK